MPSKRVQRRRGKAAPCPTVPELVAQLQLDPSAEKVRRRVGAFLATQHTTPPPQTAVLKRLRSAVGGAPRISPAKVAVAVAEAALAREPSPGYLQVQAHNTGALLVTCDVLRELLAAAQPQAAAKARQQCAASGCTQALLARARSTALSGHVSALETAFRTLLALVEGGELQQQLAQEFNERVELAQQLAQRVGGLTPAQGAATLPQLPAAADSGTTAGGLANPPLQDPTFQARFEGRVLRNTLPRAAVDNSAGRAAAAAAPFKREMRPRSAFRRQQLQAVLDAPLSPPRMRRYLSPARSVEATFQEAFVETKEARANAGKLKPLSHPRVPFAARRRPRAAAGAAPSPAVRRAAVARKERSVRARATASVAARSPDTAALVASTPAAALHAGFGTPPGQAHLPVLASPYAADQTAVMAQKRRRPGASDKLASLLATCVPAELLAETYTGGVGGGSEAQRPPPASLARDHATSTKTDALLAAKAAAEKTRLRKMLAAQAGLPGNPLQAFVDARQRARRASPHRTPPRLPPITVAAGGASQTPESLRVQFRRPPHGGVSSASPSSVAEYMAVYAASAAAFEASLHTAVERQVAAGAGVPLFSAPRASALLDSLHSGASPVYVPTVRSMPALARPTPASVASSQDERQQCDCVSEDAGLPVAVLHRAVARTLGLAVRRAARASVQQARTRAVTALLADTVHESAQKVAVACAARAVARVLAGAVAVAARQH